MTSCTCDDEDKVMMMREALKALSMFETNFQGKCIDIRFTTQLLQQCENVIIEVMIYLWGVPCLMLVLGGLLSETDTSHLAAHNCLQDGDDDSHAGFFIMRKTK